MSNDGEREELKNALIGTQESAAVQILLEAVRPVPGIEDCDDDHVLSNLKEVQSLVCSYLHETFIGDPTLAKLVHFQASNLSLLPRWPWSLVYPMYKYGMYICRGTPWSSSL